MSEHHHEAPRKIPASKFAQTAKILIYVTALILAGIIYFKFGNVGSFSEDGGGLGTSSYTNVPQEVQIKYVPADFQANLDEEMAMAILANPYRYNREFNDLIYEFNLSLLNHVATRMNLPDSTKILIREEYERQHPYLRKLYFDDFVHLKDTADNIAPVWYENAATNAVEVLNEVASKYTCTMINQVLISILKTHEGSLYVKGNKVNTPCGVALTEGLQPLIKRLEETAAINDFSRSKGLIEQKVERAIAELATMEVRDKKAINRQLQTKVWGLEVSSSDVEISAISIIKIGFKLDKYFNIEVNSKRKVVTVTLPNPEILSSDVYPRVDRLDIGWMREVGSIDFNRNIDLLRKEFRKDVLASDAMEKSKSRAYELMETMLTPVISSLNKRYVLRVKFKDVSPQLDTNIEGDPFENEQTETINASN
ncbi:MAG: DUF4230 domain-containing protein [Saprospiraceae bacterium]|nr:DUF4230 domain-containing protein [Saprospiraceae bacterium]